MTPVIFKNYCKNYTSRQSL